MRIMIQNNTKWKNVNVERLNTSSKQYILENVVGQKGRLGLQLTLDKERKPSLEKAAILLAMTQTREEEEKLKVSLKEMYDIRCSVTELGGKANDLQHTGKLTNSVISTAFNTGIIPKEARKVHALIHATLEAGDSVFIHTNSNANLALKVGLTTNFEWLAVAIHGRSSLHPLLEHERMGLGVMHL